MHWMIRLFTIGDFIAEPRGTSSNVLFLESGMVLVRVCVCFPFRGGIDSLQLLSGVSAQRFSSGLWMPLQDF